MDRGFFITLNTVRRQLMAMPSELYLVRLIHQHTRAPFPAEPLWTGFQLSRPAMIRFLRLRNREGFDVYLRPYAESRNAGYILLDLDWPGPHAVTRMRAQGHQPCVVVQTSPGHLQAWVRVSPTPLEPALATAIGKHLAGTYGGDLASTDWCHLGRLAGFTNHKPARRQPSGYAPWVRLLHAQPHSAPNPAAAAAIYQRFLDRLRIPQRFPQPDWSVADLWIAQQLFRCRTPAAQVHTILRLGSPGFPRRHSQPQDYLARTLRRAALDIQHPPFPARPCAPGVEVCRHP